MTLECPNCHSEISLRIGEDMTDVCCHQCGGRGPVDIDENGCFYFSEFEMQRTCQLCGGRAVFAFDFSEDENPEERIWKKMRVCVECREKRVDGWVKNVEWIPRDLVNREGLVKTIVAGDYLNIVISCDTGKWSSTGGITITDSWRTIVIDRCYHHFMSRGEAEEIVRLVEQRLRGEFVEHEMIREWRRSR